MLVWVYYSKDGHSWVSQTSEEEAQVASETQPSHIYFFAELDELQAA